MKIRILSALLIVSGLVILTGCDSSKYHKSSGDSVESLTLGVSDPRNLSALIWIAEAQGYFSEHGLKIDFKSYESGLAATKDLLAGKVDLETHPDSGFDDVQCGRRYSEKLPFALQLLHHQARGPDAVCVGYQVNRRFLVCRSKAASQ